MPKWRTPRWCHRQRPVRVVAFGAIHDPRRARERASSARGPDHRRRIGHRYPRRPLRHRRRRAYRSGALRGVQRAGRAGRGALPALRRHLDRDHRADQRAFLPRPSRPGRGHDGRGAGLGLAGGGRRRGRLGRGGLCARRGAQDRLRAGRYRDRIQAARRPRQLAARRRSAGPRRDDRLWFLSSGSPPR